MANEGTNALYRSGAWRRLRRVVLERDGWVCAFCRRGIDRDVKAGPGMASVDHIVPLCQGGERLNPANMRAAHHGCNTRAGHYQRSDRFVYQPRREW